MAKFLIVLCAFVACAYAKPGFISTPLATAPLTAVSFNAPQDAAYASSRLDIQQRYGPALFAAAPAKLLAPAAPVAAPLTATYAAPLAAASAKLLAAGPVAAPLTAAVAAPVAYANHPLDAAFASRRIDIHQNHAAALVPTAFAAAPAKFVAPIATVPLSAAPAKLVAPAPVATVLAAPVAAQAKLFAPATPVAAASLAVAPAKFVTPASFAAPLAAPLAYTNHPLNAAYASSRLDLHQNYRSAFVPTFYAAAPTKFVAPAKSAATPVDSVETLKYTAATPDFKDKH